MTPMTEEQKRAKRTAYQAERRAKLRKAGLTATGEKPKNGKAPAKSLFKRALKAAVKATKPAAKSGPMTEDEKRAKRTAYQAARRAALRGETPAASPKFNKPPQRAPQNGTAGSSAAAMAREADKLSAQAQSLRLKAAKQEVSEAAATLKTATRDHEAATKRLEKLEAR
jgi:hypothetical protein